MGFKYYEDPILGKGRAQVTGGTGGGGGTEYVGGNRISIGGETISFVNSADIVNVTGTSVTLQPDTAYKIYATSQAITLNANPPAAGKWAYEGHLEIFTAGTGYIVTGSNVVLANALEPDSVNNCTVRFHDGLAIISVEDHIAGYIVVNGSTSGDGSLYYGITTSTNDYVAFDASLNGQTIPLAGAVAEGEKHVVGNGYTETILTGDVDCGTSKFTVANLGLNNVQITGGTMTLGDVNIPSGSTVAFNGGGLAIEKVTGAGSASVIDLGYNSVTQTGGTRIVVSSGVTASANECTFTHGLASNNNGGAFNISSGGVARFNSCGFAFNTATRGGAFYFTNGASGVFSGCYFDSNFANAGDHVAFYGGTGSFDGCTFERAHIAAMEIRNAAVVEITNCSFDSSCMIQNTANAGNAFVSFGGSNAMTNIVSGASMTVTLTSGAVVDLTGNTNTTPINPGGGVIVDGGCQVITSAGSTVSIAGGTYTKINNDGTTE
jgi:hypothetical protein